MKLLRIFYGFIKSVFDLKTYINTIHLILEKLAMKIICGNRGIG